MPFPVCTTSSDWASDQGINLEVGEYPLIRRKFEFNGANPAATGEHFCGTEDEWFYGEVYDPERPHTIYQENGLPTCCGVLGVFEMCWCSNPSGKTTFFPIDKSYICTCATITGARVVTHNHESTICTCATIEGTTELEPLLKSEICTCATIEGTTELEPLLKSEICTCAEPSGELICCTPGSKPVIEPGDDCDTAYEPVLDTEYYFLSGTEGESWFKIEVPADTIYYFAIHNMCLSPSLSNYYLYQGTTCADKSLISSGSFGCQSMEGPGTFWVRITYFAEGICLTAELGTGFCP